VVLKLRLIGVVEEVIVELGCVQKNGPGPELKEVGDPLEEEFQELNRELKERIIEDGRGEGLEEQGWVERGGVVLPLVYSKHQWEQPSPPTQPEGRGKTLRYRSPPSPSRIRLRARPSALLI
jgi:hypothetical protein